jgi:hypothetical protein
MTPKPTKDQKARIKTLLKQHQMTWLGEIGDVMLAMDLRYERGFPVAGALDGSARGEAIVRVTGHRSWRTFTALDIRGDAPGYHPYLAHEVFFGLRELTTASASAFEDFTAAPRQLRRVVFSGGLDGLSDRFLEGAATPELRTIGIIHWTRATPMSGGLQRVLGSSLGARLERLELYQSEEAVGGLEDWIVAVLESETGLDDLLFTAPRSYRHAAGFHYELTREQGEWHIKATYKTRPNKPDNFGLLATLLPRLRAIPIARVVVKTPRYSADPAAVSALRRSAGDVEIGI